MSPSTTVMRTAKWLRAALRFTSAFRPQTLTVFRFRDEFLASACVWLSKRDLKIGFSEREEFSGGIQFSRPSGNPVTNATCCDLRRGREAEKSQEDRKMGKLQITSQGSASNMEN